jgi:hypothetical protein
VESKAPVIESKAPVIDSKPALIDSKLPAVTDSIAPLPANVKTESKIESKNQLLALLKKPTVDDQIAQQSHSNVNEIQLHNKSLQIDNDAAIRIDAKNSSGVNTARSAIQNSEPNFMLETSNTYIEAIKVLYVCFCSKKRLITIFCY